MEKIKYVCEVCGKTEIMTPEEAYQEGWDYPPFMGSYGVVSARTCPRCPMMKTASQKVKCGMKRDGGEILYVDTQP